MPVLVFILEFEVQKFFNGNAFAIVASFLLAEVNVFLLLLISWLLLLMQRIPKRNALIGFKIFPVS